MKTIGVLGGIGPHATMEFEERIHTISQRLIPQRANASYPPMIVYYHRSAPVLTHDDGTPIFPIQPDPRLLEAAQVLGRLADFLVIISNSAHLLQAAIEQKAERNVLSMIDVTLQEVHRRGIKRIGVLTLYQPTVYKIPLEQRGIACEFLPPDMGHALDQAIFQIPAGTAGPADYAAARQAVEYLRSREVEAIILGCTEIAPLLQDGADAPDLINPLHLLAEATVAHALT
jgi:aspartate racemase